MLAFLAGVGVEIGPCPGGRARLAAVVAVRPAINLRGVEARFSATFQRS